MLTRCVPLLLATTAVAQIPGIGPSGPIVRAETGFFFTEGPAQDAAGNLYFSDVPGSTIYRVDTSGRRSTFLRPSGNSNGIYFDRQDRMLVCRHAGDLVEIDTRSKAIKTLAGTFNSKRFNSPNDVVPDVYGGTYFTDPTFGGNFQDKEAVYYRAAGGKVTRIIDDLVRPNGVILAPGESVLYVASQSPSAVMSYPVLGPGRIGAGQRFFPLAGQSVDGMTVDTKGNVYMTRPGLSAIEVVTPAGKSLGRITFPERPANCAFGGSDMKTLLVTARRSLYRARMIATGHRPARLTVSVDRISVRGGSVQLGVHTSVFHKGDLYLMLGTTSGTAPGLVVGGTRVPINFDAFTGLALALASTPVLARFAGLLDANGRAAPALNLPAVDPGLAGVEMHFAAVLLGAVGASDAAKVTLTR